MAVSCVVRGLILALVPLALTPPCLSAGEPVAAGQASFGAEAKKVARAMLKAVEAQPLACPSIGVDVEFGNQCAAFAGTVDEFTRNWDLAVEKLAANLKPAGDWKTGRLEHYRYRDYDLDGRWFGVVYINATRRGVVQIVYDVSAPRASADGSADVEGPEAGVGEVSKPMLLSRTMPEYPTKARANRLEGRVVVRAIIRADGKVAEPTVLRALPAGFGMEEAAVKAVKHWRYEPARRNGEPIDVWFEVVVDFRFH